MAKLSRRAFLNQSTAGLLTVAGVALILPADAAPTEPSGLDDHLDGHIHAGYENHDAPLLAAGPSAADTYRLPVGQVPTEDNILGPYYRSGSPFRGKVTAVGEVGSLLVVQGRVWSYDTKRPLANAILDIWQANAKGRYDNDDPVRPPAPGVYRNRIRLVTDEMGRYEFETIQPGRYKTSPDIWRPSHIHYAISAPGHQTLVTQLYFEGDPYNDTDLFIKKSLIIKLATVTQNTTSYKHGVFDIVLRHAVSS